MHHTDYLIIGGGIAGTTAAETIRQHDEHGTIAIITKEPHVLYSRVLLPKYIERNIPRDRTFLRTAEDYSRRFIDLFANEEVTILDLERKEARTRNGSVFFFKKLLLAGGGRVKEWRVAGINAVPVHRLQTIEDADTIFENVGHRALPDVLIAGGGFITLELLNALVPRGIPVRVLVPEQRYWSTCLDETGSGFLETHLDRSGVTVHTGETPTQLDNKETGGITVYTNKHNAFDVGMLAAGIGIDREIGPFTGMGIAINRGITTNEFLETTVDGVWAAGDIAEFFHPIFERRLLIGNWNNAFLQGRLAGRNMALRHTGTGEAEAYTQIPLYAIDVLGMHIAFVGDTAIEEGGTYEYAARFVSDTFYERFIMRGNRLVGAILMNKFEDRPAIEQFIRKKIDVARIKQHFNDPAVSLPGLL